MCNGSELEPLREANIRAPPHFEIMNVDGSERYKEDCLKKNILKCSFEPKKPRKDGLVLQVHHTLPEPGGKVRSYRFTSASFDLSGERLAVSDSSGNAFVIDLLTNKFWMLPKLPACNFMTFSRYVPRKQEIFMGNINGPIQFVNCETGDVMGELVGHKNPPINISFPEQEEYCITMCSSSAIIWDLRINSMLHQLTLRSSVGIKQVVFMPVSNNIFGLFEDNSIHIWKLDNLKCAKQIFPDEWGGPNIRSIAFTRNGRGLVVGGQTCALAVFLVDSWTLQKIISLPEHCRGVKQLQFIPQLFDGGANKVLAVLSTSCSVMFVDTETSVLLTTMDQVDGCVSRLESSLNGKYLVLVMQTGEVNIYSSSLVHGGQHELLVSEAKGPSSVSQRHLDHVIDKEVSSLIDLSRLRPILKEFGEYPDIHRNIIWKMLLKLPENKSAYVALINKGTHPSLSNLDKIFPLRDRSLSGSVKRLLSCLAYWSPIFIQVKYLPVFSLPFIKLFKHDQFTCFETVTSIIVNWCQRWYEYVPYPPLNVLDSIKSLLREHDSQLVDHYIKHGVSVDLYVWSLLETAFYEVLGWEEWKQLWDHVLSNHPAFLYFTAVAFNITCRSSLMYLQQLDDFEHFFHSEVVINMKQLIGKSYELWSNTPTDLHPKNVIKQFKPLVPGQMYQVFTDYPKHLLDQQLKKLSTLYEEQSTLESQEVEVNKHKQSLQAEKQRLLDARLKETRLKELESAYKHALKKEEERLENQRRTVSEARKDLRKKEVVMRTQSVSKSLQGRADKYAHLSTLVDRFDIKKPSSELQSGGSWSASCQSTNSTSLRLQHASVVHHITKLKRLCRQSAMDHPRLKHCIRKFEEALQRIEAALEQEQTSKQLTSEQITDLEEETRALEDEAEDLLRKLRVNPEKHCTKLCSHCSHMEDWHPKKSQGTCYCCGDGRH